jgi:ribosomal protein S27E
MNGRKKTFCKEKTMKIRKILQGSVTFCDVECPKCGRVAKLLDYPDSKETIECPQCGYQSQTDRETNETTIEYGCGVLYAEFYNKPLVYYVFDVPPTQKEINDFLKIFEDNFIIKEKSYFYLYDPTSNQFTVLKGSQPKTFDEYVERHVQEMEYEKYLSSYRYMSLSNGYEPFE